jgi:TPR repeat protein
VPQDDAAAAGWWRKAADQGDPAAQVRLGSLYAAGQGVPQDYVQAHLWVNLAASRTPAGKAQDDMIRFRDALAHALTATQLAEAQKLAREWRPK